MNLSKCREIMIKRVIRIKNVVKSANRSSASSNVLSASGSRYRIDEELRWV